MSGVVRCLCGVVLLVLLGCNGRLTREERGIVKKITAANTIKKIPKIDIIEAAFVYGRLVATRANEIIPGLDDAAVVDSLQQAYGVTIRRLHPGMARATAVEQQLVKAYLAIKNSKHITDNVQVIASDSLLYTMPVIKKMGDNAVRFAYAVEVLMPTRQVILFMDRHTNLD